MDLNGRVSEAESSNSYNRTLHWSPLSSWNLFSNNHNGRARSRVPLEIPPPPPPRLHRSRSLRNSSDEGRQNLLVSARGYDSRLRKAGDHSHREEGIVRRGNIPGSNEQPRMISSGYESITRGRIPRNRTHRDELENARINRIRRPSASIESENGRVNRISRPSSNMSHHQQQNCFHDHHHHHHHHYHHLHHHSSRLSNEHQEQGTSMSVSGSLDASNIPSSLRRSSDSHRSFASRRSSVVSNVSRGSNPRDMAMEARDRLDERFRSAALISQRHRNPSFLEEFSLLFGDDDDFWNDDEMWEVGIQDWLAYVEGWHNSDSGTSGQCSVSKGLSKSAIQRLHKEVYLPKVRRKDKEVKDDSLEHDDCAVCLERFRTGQLLVHLPCHHRFHPDCLSPWLETHAQCPYCRAKVKEEMMDESRASGPSNDDLITWMETLNAGLARFASM